MHKVLHPKKSLNTVLIKPAGPDCNMACTYCFYLEKKKLYPNSTVHRMSEETLEVMIQQVMSQTGQQVSFDWQGGEPTLMGLSFFQKAVELQQSYGHRQLVSNGLQTNGLLIDRTWARFLGEYNFLVGLSLDGPEHIHNHYRLLSSGADSWSRVMDSGKIMQDSGVAVNAISVISDYSAKFPEEIYAFHKKMGFPYMQFIPCVETDPSDPKKAAPFSVSGENYGQFLCTLFDQWLNDFQNELPTTSIRFFESLLCSYAGMGSPQCTLLKECGVYVVVEHNGDVYSCDFFVEPKWKLGNIMSSRLVDMLNSTKQREFGRLKARLPELCKECRWLRFCRSGCVKDRIRDPKDNNLNHFCQGYKEFFKHADSRLKHLAEKAKR